MRKKEGQREEGMREEGKEKARRGGRDKGN